MKLALALPLAVVLTASIVACGGSSGHEAAAGRPAVAPSAAASSAVAETGPSPCATAVSGWDAISLPYTPAPASPENSVAQDMLRLRSATSAGDEALVEVVGQRIAKAALAVLHHDLPPRCAPGLRHSVRLQMVYAGIAGVGMELGNFGSAANAMKRAVACQKQVMADEDAITGSDMGGW